MNLAPEALEVINMGGSYEGGIIPPALINAYSAMAITPYWRAMNFLATNLAAFPRSVRQNGNRMDDAEPHPLAKLLRRKPNGYQTPQVMWRTFYYHAANKGNGYLWIERDAATFKPIGLHNLLPEDVHPIRYIHEGEKTPTQYYLVRSTKTVLSGADVIHIQALGHDGHCGTNPVEQHEATFQQAMALDRFQTRFLQKGTMIRAAIELPEAVGADDDLVDEIQETMRRYFRGADAERDIVVLPNGAKLNNATLSPADSQLAEQGAVLTKKIAQITGVPPHFLYEFKDAKYNNLTEQMGQDVVRYTFLPWIQQTEEELTAKLLTDDELDEGYAIHLNPDALLRGSSKEQMEVVTLGVKSGIYTENEGRGLIGMPAVADASANQLKRLGDTAPPPAAGDAEAE
ncbi:MAG TPA: phage portal protein [Tepidisphaeraceae bacterium]|jgi:HK97 family phage portal protein|nr:phage portal protein [Tepidisphaeraceae bacterium]